MKFRLGVKLMASYAVILALTIVFLIAVTDKILINHFDDYINNVRNSATEAIITETKEVFANEEEPVFSDFYLIASAALNSGMLYTVYDSNGEELLCMEDQHPKESLEMKKKVEDKMKEFNLLYTGDYFEESFDISVDKEYQGKVVLKHFDPVHYTKSEADMLKSIRQTHIKVGLLFFILAILLSVFLANTLTKPIKKITEKTKEVKDGKYLEMINTHSTTTEISELESSFNNLIQSLDNQEKIKEQMALNYAHEIRTPLSTISTILESVNDGVIELDHGIITSLTREVNRLISLVKDLDQLSQHSNGNFNLVLSDFNIVEKIEGVVQLFRLEMDQKKIEVKIENKLTRNQEIIKADKEKMKSVFINLFSNAIKYNNGGGQINVMLSYDGRHHISIKDQGIGIEEAELPFIFEHLYRVDKARVSSAKGLGLGLSVVKSIIDAHGGSISVESELDKGSTFIITL